MSQNKIDPVLLQKMHQSYLDSPHSVDPSWRDLFALKKKSTKSIPAYSISNYSSNVENVLKAMDLLRSFRTSGYLAADLDPIGVLKTPTVSDLDLASHGIKDLNSDTGLDELFGSNGTTFGELLELLKKVYCSKIGIQFMHLTNNQERCWIEEKCEKNLNYQNEFSPELKKKIFDILIKAEGLEDFIHLKFKGAKRFSVEGSETSLVAMEAIIDTATGFGVEEIVVGMAHRGRLNFLTNILGKKYRALFFEFAGNHTFPESFCASGDVKYHMGTFCDRKSLSGKDVHVSLCANPSHLEAVNPVALGKVKAKQDFGKNAMSVLVHGDASFSGQGVVYESMILEGPSDYKVGGTIHIIINNQVGFTTSPDCARDFPFPSFIGQALDVPIFHVNGDDPEAVMRVSILAAEFRNTFKKDVIIDLVSYRRYGHNEGDEPRFTQPKMYKNIDQHQRITSIYGNQLIAAGVISQSDFDNAKQNFKQVLEEELKASNTYTPSKDDWIENTWADFEVECAPKHHKFITGVEKSRLIDIASKLLAVPEGFAINNKVARLFEHRYKALETGCDIDWGNGESLAFATLVQDGINIRLAGQDCKRGTFSHRHAVLVDQETENTFIPINSLSDAKIQVINSPLSEYAALGFEYGYSLVSPKNLVLWEAQFGDFVNGAQIVIDQFISSGETKWLSLSGLVMLLPHGYEGQGPEHSSARIERFLQLAAEGNMRIVNCTTPANYFHALRRQVCGNIRKPLVVFTPKSLLRHKLAVSKLDDFVGDKSFDEIIVDDNFTGKARKIIFCSGKVYYDVLQAKLDKNINDILLIRIEQLYPFPEEDILKEVTKHQNAQIIWCQEEPKNMGSWFFVSTILRELCKKDIKYAGRESAASPATGYLKVHSTQQDKFISEALA